MAASDNATPPKHRPWLETVFVSSAEPRLRAGWRLALQVILQLVFSTCLGLVVVLSWRNLFLGELGRLSAVQFMGLEVVDLLAVTASVAIARRFLDHRSFSSLGLRPGRRAVQDLGAGLLITFVMMGLIFLAEFALGWLRVAGFSWQTQPAAEVAKNAGAFALICILVGWNEELMSRGYHLQTLASGLSTRWGWILSSLAFGMLHLGNPNASWMAAAGIFLAGVFLGYAYIRSGQLWLPIGLHIGWNFFEGVVFGFPVSGLPFYQLPHTLVSGPDLWTGGAFGPEAGLLLIPALAIGSLLVQMYTRWKPAP